MKVLGYCRVATAGQPNNGALLDAQREQTNRYVTTKGWPVAEYFMDIGVSGSIPLADRLEGRRLLASLLPDDVVVAAALDNISRDAAQALEVVEKLKQKNIAVHVVGIGGDITRNVVQNLRLTHRVENEREHTPDVSPEAQIIDFRERGLKKDP